MIEYNINMREEIFGSTLLNLKNGQREYLNQIETKKILEEGIFPKDSCTKELKEKLMIKFTKNNNISENIILDAIHSPVEWHIIKQHFPNAELIEVITPDSIRLQRITLLDIEKDKKRIEHWHSENGCLLSEVGWSFNGVASKELNEQSFREFIDYIKQKDRHEQEKGKDLTL